MLVKMPNGEWIDPGSVIRVMGVRSASDAMTRASKILDSIVGKGAADKTPRVLVIYKIGAGDGVITLYCESDLEVQQLSDQVASVINDSLMIRGEANPVR